MTPIRSLALVALAGAVAGALACGGRASAASSTGPQQFTRRIQATPAQVVTATVQTFSEYDIPVASADEVEGEVRSSTLELQGQWGYGPTSDRVNCGVDTTGTAGADQGVTRLDVRVRARESDGGSVVELNAEGRNQAAPGASGNGRCVLTSAFITELLNSIEAKAIGR